MIWNTDNYKHLLKSIIKYEAFVSMYQEYKRIYKIVKTDPTKSNNTPRKF
jgi:hypothetical protein